MRAAERRRESIISMQFLEEGQGSYRKERRDQRDDEGDDVGHDQGDGKVDVRRRALGAKMIQRAGTDGKDDGEIEEGCASRKGILSWLVNRARFGSEGQVGANPAKRDWLILILVKVDRVSRSCS